MSGEEDQLAAVLPLIRKPCDVFEIVAALHQHRSVAVQDILVSKLYEAKSHDVEFFLPQLWYVRVEGSIESEESLLVVFCPC